MLRKLENGHVEVLEVALLRRDDARLRNAVAPILVIVKAGMNNVSSLSSLHLNYTNTN